MRRVMAHICNRKGERIDAFVFSQSDEGVSHNACHKGSHADDDKECDSNNDIVIAHHTEDSSSNDDQSNTDSSDFDAHTECTGKVPIIAQLPRMTRSGRNVAT